MMACLDVHYTEHLACAAAIVFDNWLSEKHLAEYFLRVKTDHEYKPGQFYLRELSPLLAVIERIAEPVNTLIIDAYCYLSADYTPGLGAYLYSAIGRSAFVIGVAKNRYKNTTHAEEVFRGGSTRALFVTSVGFSQKKAAAKIASMAGPYRIPTLLRAVDQLARGKH